MVKTVFLSVLTITTLQSRKTGVTRIGRNKSKSSGKKRKMDFRSKRRAEATKCRCRRTRALKDKERREFMQDDHSTRDFLDMSESSDHGIFFSLQLLTKYLKATECFDFRDHIDTNKVSFFHFIHEFSTIH